MTATAVTDTTIAKLKEEIEKLKNKMDDHYHDNHNQTDSHIMWLVGKIDGIRHAIRVLEYRNE